MQTISYIQKLIGTENFYKWIITVFLSSFILSVLNIILYSVFLKTKFEKDKILKFIISDGIIRFVLTIALPPPYYRVFIVINSVILMHLIFNQNIEKCLLNEALNVVIVFIVEMLSISTLQIIGVNTNTYIEIVFNYKYRLLLISAITLFEIIVCYIAKKKNLAFNINNNLMPKDRMNISLVSVVIYLVVFLNMVQITVFNTNIHYIVLILEIFSLIYFFRLSLGNIEKAIEIKDKNLKINDLMLHNKTLSNMYDSMRGFKHDFCNFVQALDGYVENKDISGIKKMCNSITKDCKEVTNLQALDPKIINNPAIYSILTNKYYMAKEDNICMDIEVMVNLENFNIDIYKLSKILSILLDNAIEAARDSKEKIINVKFSNDNKYKRKLVIVENSYINKVDIDKIFEKGYSTKESNSKDHGLGLWNVRKILKQVNNINLYTTAGKMFRQQLEIYD